MSEDDRPADEGTRWRKALREAAARREFPNLLFAEKWMRALDRAGMYPRSPWKEHGE